ncbi:uncharacterized protein METZ01_LOCUS462834, partial [marine metagenome]
MKKTLLLVILIIGCDTSVNTTGQECGGEIIEGYCYGCTDPKACNWDPGASRFDNSCTYIPEGACDCANNTYDCLGICGGTAIIDVCDVCGGNGILEGACDCAGNGPIENYDCVGNCIVTVDCTGECGGSIVDDECGVCGGNGISEGSCDCDGNIYD